MTPAAKAKLRWTDPTRVGDTLDELAALRARREAEAEELAAQPQQLDLFADGAGR